jgi:hypothetical protein
MIYVRVYKRLILTEVSNAVNYYVSHNPVHVKNIDYSIDSDSYTTHMKHIKHTGNNLKIEWRDYNAYG